MTVTLVISRPLIFHTNICRVEVLNSGESFLSGGTPGDEGNQCEHSVFVIDVPSLQVLSKGARSKLSNSLRSAYGNEGPRNESKEQIVEFVKEFFGTL